MRLIDIAGWRADDLFSPYPEGSRDKYAVIAPTDHCPPEIIPGHRYLMKFSNKRYPVQFWSEIIATIIGDALGVPTPPAFVAVDPTSGNPGSLIEWFYGPRLEGSQKWGGNGGSGFRSAFRALFGGKEVPETHSLYVPGSNYMTRAVPGYDLKTGTQHNFMDIAVWITLFSKGSDQDFWAYWAQMLLFDALIGNTDRHQDNWGVLWRAGKDGGTIPRFAPAFDNGTSLAHEIMEERLTTFATAAAIDRYVRRGRHHMRWQRRDEKPCHHFELLQRLTTYRPRLAPSLAKMVRIDFSAVYARIRLLTDMPAPVPLSEERVDVICRMIERRLEIFREVFTP